MSDLSGLSKESRLHLWARLVPADDEDEVKKDSAKESARRSKEKRKERKRESQSRKHSHRCHHSRRELCPCFKHLKKVEKHLKMVEKKLKRCEKDRKRDERSKKEKVKRKHRSVSPESSAYYREERQTRDDPPFSKTAWDAPYDGRYYWQHDVRSGRADSSRTSRRTQGILKDNRNLRFQRVEEK